MLACTMGTLGTHGACIAKVVFFWRLLKRKLCEEVYPLLDRSFSEEVPLVEPPKMGTLGTHGACIRLSSFGGYCRVLLDCLCEEVYPRSDSSSYRIMFYLLHFQNGSDQTAVQVFKLVRPTPRLSQVHLVANVDISCTESDLGSGSNLTESCESGRRECFIAFHRSTGSAIDCLDQDELDITTNNDARSLRISPVYT